MALKFTQPLIEISTRKCFLPRSNGCRSKEGEIIREEGKSLRRWEEYFKELLCTEQQDEDKERERDESDQEEPRIRRTETEEVEEVHTPTCEEIAACIKKTKNNKAPGEDFIMAELIKYGGDERMDAMHKPITMI
jgi:hypothetical protein